LSSLISSLNPQKSLPRIFALQLLPSPKLITRDPPMKFARTALIISGLCATSQAFFAPSARPSLLLRGFAPTRSTTPCLRASSLAEFETEYAKSLTPEWWADLAKSSLDCE
jgi:hypothetical protein